MGGFKNKESEMAWKEFRESVLSRDSRQFEIYSKFVALQNGEDKEAQEDLELS